MDGTMEFSESSHIEWYCFRHRIRLWIRYTTIVQNFCEKCKQNQLKLKIITHQMPIQYQSNASFSHFFF